VNRYAAALSQHPVPAHAVGEVVGFLLEQLEAEPPDLLVLFASSHFAGALDDMTEVLRDLIEPRVLVGMTAAAVIGGSVEAEEVPALSAWAACLDGDVEPVTLRTVRTAEGMAVSGWPPDDPVTGAITTPEDGDTLLLLADPFTFPVEPFLDRVADEWPGLQVVGGLASAAAGPGGARLAIDGAVLHEGAVGVLLRGGPSVRAVVSQGCRPIGQAYIVTDSEDNVVKELAGKPSLERLAEIAAVLPEDDRALLDHGLQLGIVVDEHRAEFGRGDFLVRSVLGADRSDGSVVVGTDVPVGTTVQFQVRDALAADEDLRELLTGVEGRGALLFSCTGRGEHLFAEPHHDAQTIEDMLGPLPLAGAFCAGELGPVSGRNHVHAFTASVVVFGD
jgi:small ligand-binding sensory domain FIST